MSSDRKNRHGFKILSEEVVTRPVAGDVEDIENPYWLAEEPAPHPDPSKGCVRRGICCKTSPGWFGPGEVEKAAEWKGMTADEFVRTYLVIDDLEVDGDRVFVFAPAKLGRDGKPSIPPASRVDGLYRALRGTCIFFKKDGCSIYPVRPMECAAYVCTNEPEDNLNHETIARLWKSGPSS